MVEQMFPCSPWKATMEQIPALQPVEDPILEQAGIS